MSMYFSSRKAVIGFVCEVSSMKSALPLVNVITVPIILIVIRKIYNILNIILHTVLTHLVGVTLEDEEVLQLQLTM